LESRQRKKAVMIQPMATINDILSQFVSIRLEEMDAVKLMDRTETKFLIPADMLLHALQQIKKHYHCQENFLKRTAKYETLYYDTPGFSLYMKHHNGELNRYKVRHRTYMGSNQGFLEVKYRNNKGRSMKKRIEEAHAPLQFTGNALNFLSSELPFQPALLQPVVTVNYSRITLVSEHYTERITIDTDIEFRRNGELVHLENVAIAEIKQSNKTRSVFQDTMKSMQLRETPFSKYCSAVAMMCDGVKRNNFKENLLTLKYLSHDFAASQ
jgi:hypothetical protein